MIHSVNYTDRHRNILVITYIPTFSDKVVTLRFAGKARLRQSIASFKRVRKYQYYTIHRGLIINRMPLDVP